ncbi:MAG: DUF1080 domain-containing protein [Verrucomicrobiota bacterium]
MRHTFCLGCLLLSIGAFAADGWKPLFNGKDFAGWQTYLSAPEAGWQVSGLKRATNGNYLEPVGLNHDPLKVFTVGTVDGRPAIHISGQGYGTLTTTANFTNFHLRLQMKWGEKRWGKRATAPRDSGLLYFGHGTPGAMSGNWPRSIEFQIQEHDIGDLYPIGARITVKAVQPTTNSWAYDREGAPRVFEKNRRCIKHGDAEKPNGEWNTLELICLHGDSVHIVNGRVMMRLTHAERVDGKNPEPLTSGHLSLQTEGAEVFYRDIEIQPILEMPRAFLE